MINIRQSLVFVLALGVSLAAIAGPNADALGRCLTDNTSGKERKVLARWMFVGMSTHAEMKGLSAATQADLEQSSKAIGELFTRLLSDSCASEARQAIQTEGAQSMQTAFATLGQVAMQELMTDQNVNSAMSLFERYVDQKKVEAALAGR